MSRTNSLPGDTPQAARAPWLAPRSWPLHIWVAAVLVIACGYLACKNLDSAVLWDDEAETAILARNLVHGGETTAWDGRNLFAFRNGTTVDKDLRTRQPPLMFYATAASFYVFGATTWAARFPYVLTGLATLLLLYRYLRRAFADEPLVALYGVATMGLSMQFLLSIRECRYYSLCLFFSMLTFDQYRRCLDAKGKARHALGLALGATGMFFGNYLLCAVFLLGLAILHPLYRDRWSKPVHLRLIGAAGLFLALTIPFTLSNRIWDRSDLPPLTAPWYVCKANLLCRYVRDLNEINALPFLALLGIAYVAWKKPAWRQAAIAYAGLALLNAAIMGFVTPQPWHAGEPADARYLIASLPFAAAAIALALATLHRAQPVLAIAALAVLVCTNALGYQHKFDYRWLLPAYLNEIHNPYPTEQSVASQTIRDVAKFDDLVMTVPSWESAPLLFYVGDKVRVCCLLNDGSPLVRSGLIPQLAPAMRMETNFPRWILAYGNDASIPFVFNYMQREHMEGSELKRYHYEPVKKLGVYFKGTQRSELMFHSFGPKTDYDPAKEDVVLYRRND